jgi:hypothetical protein
LTSTSFLIISSPTSFWIRHDFKPDINPSPSSFQLRHLSWFYQARYNFESDIIIKPVIVRYQYQARYNFESDIIIKPVIILSPISISSLLSFQVWYHYQACYHLESDINIKPVIISNPISLSSSLSFWVRYHYQARYHFESDIIIKPVIILNPTSYQAWYQFKSVITLTSTSYFDIVPSLTSFYFHRDIISTSNKRDVWFTASTSSFMQ